MLQVLGNRIIDETGKSIMLRGTCVGGWMNFEDFINGYPGTESNIRKQVGKVLGTEKGDYFFSAMQENFLNEGDIRFIAETGANCIRIPLNYRHFEDDTKPFIYKESGFAKLESIVSLCEKHNLYVILDMHAVQGWQNCHWHSDNERGASLFWSHPHFQERLARLWMEIARRYVGRDCIAGYEVMNEPASNTPNGDHPFDFYENYSSDWKKLNNVYDYLVNEIRTVDSDHIIFLEGDRYGHLFDQMDSPQYPNLAYSSHNYTPPGFGPGKYPGFYGNDNKKFWDREKHFNEFYNDEGTRFSREHNVPLWVGEFGSQYHGPEEQVPYRLQSMDDQLSVFNELSAHWTTWTYKDAGVMGWVTLDPDSEYSQLIAPVQKKKKELGCENFVALYEDSPGRIKSRELADMILELSGGDYNPRSNAFCLNYAALTGYTASILQPEYAKIFKGFSKSDIDRVMKSFHIDSCVKNEAFLAILRNRIKDTPTS